MLSPTPYSNLAAPHQAASIPVPHAKVELEHRAYARQVRKTMTDAELKFWNAVRAHRLDGLSFRRQLPVSGYIVDFACPSHKIIVELDGFQHAEDAAAAYDQQRTRTFEELGWTILRFWNEDILKDIDNVCLHIIRTVKEDRP
nr:endonuclease domain-containing protein [Agrobacterium tumefaciens]